MNRLIDHTPEEISAFLKELGEPAFRGNQIFSWLYLEKKIEEMTNLKKELRDTLKNCVSEGYAETELVQTSQDGTKKYLLKMQDGSLIESVLMKYHHGNSICISTQVGCAMGCRFCASQKGGLIRNLSAGEIVSEVVHVNRLEGEGRQISNVVFMGTGEPFANYENTVKAIRLLNHEKGLNISARNISVSTCGLVTEIRQFATEKLPVTLCLSLHSAFDEKRKRIMPIANRYTVEETIAAMKDYFEATGRRVILEYILIDGFNNKEEDVEELWRITRGLNAHINLIAYNAVEGVEFLAPKKSDVYRFSEQLSQRGVSATIRRSLGDDIDGACGQLRARRIGL